MALDRAAIESAVATPTLSDADEKTVADVANYPSEEIESIKDFPMRWKLTALICGVALSWGSSFSENTLGPLKSTLKKQLDINNSQVSIRLSER